MIIQWKQFKDETWSQIVLLVHLQVDHNFCKDFSFLPEQVFDIHVTRWVVFVSVGVGVGACQRIPLSVLARNPHKGLAREISLGTGRGGRKEGRKVSRRNQKDAEQRSGPNRAVDRRRRKPIVKRRKATARTCGLRGQVAQCERMSQHFL